MTQKLTKLFLTAEWPWDGEDKENSQHFGRRTWKEETTQKIAWMGW